MKLERPASKDVIGDGRYGRVMRKLFEVGFLKIWSAQY